MVTSENQQPVSRWSTSFWTQVRATVLGGLILAGILAVLGVALSQLSNLSGSQILDYVVFPGLGLIVLVVVALAIRAAWRTFRQWSAWQMNVSVHVVSLVKDLRRLYLRDVIYVATIWNWNVFEDDEHDLGFASEDQDLYFVSDTAPDPDAVAAELHNLAPAHFPEDWRSYLSGAANPRVDSLEERAGRLEQDVAELDDKLALGTLRAALSVIAAEAEPRGWTVEWYADRTVFVNEKTSKMATVEHDSVDLAKLRKALGLIPARPG